MSEEFFPRDNRQPRHFWADNEIIDQFGAKLGAHGIAVYMALARSAMNNSGECKSSMRKIAAQIGASPASVFNALSAILQLGLARKIEEGDNRHCASYVLADVKALTDPNHAQLRLAASVHLINAESSERSIGERSVQQVNASVQPVNAAFNRRTRNKEDKTSLQDYKTKSKAVDPESAESMERFNSISSSENRDDDIEINPSDLARVLKAYQESPVTTGHVNSADRATACAWLSGRPFAGHRDMVFKAWTAEQIENGIILGTVRRLGASQDVFKGAPQPLPPVRSLQYFHQVIMEAKDDRNLTEAYIDNCRRIIARESKKRAEARA